MPWPPCPSLRTPLEVTESSLDKVKLGLYFNMTILFYSRVCLASLDVLMQIQSKVLRNAEVISTLTSQLSVSQSSAVLHDKLSKHLGWLCVCCSVGRSR